MSVPFYRKNYCSKPENEEEKEVIFNIINIDHEDSSFGEDEQNEQEETVSNKEEEQSDKYLIRLYGVNKYGESIQADIHGFTPFYYITVPESFTKTFITSLLNSYALARFKNSIIVEKCILVEREKFIGFTNHKKFKFLRLTFNNLAAMKKSSVVFSRPIKLSVYSSPIKCEIYESNIEPFLRFIHIKNLDPTGWIKLTNADEMEDGYSACNRYYSVKWGNVSPLSDEDRKLYNIPHGPAPFISAAFDIECTSADGGFPKAVRTEDAVIMIATTFRRFGEKQSFLKVIHHLKKSNPITDQENVEMVYCKNERELLISWRDLLQNLDPDIIYGYNSNGFDFNYMHDRAVFHKIDTDWLMMSRVKYRSAKWEVKRLSSSALGDNEHKYVAMDGRIIMDVMKEIQKEPDRLDKYTLDFVLNYYLKDNKVDLKPQELFDCYASGSLEDIHTIAVYCLKDTESCHDLVQFKNLMMKAIKMASVCLVPLEYIFLRGQGVKIFSLISYECARDNKLIPVIKKKYSNATTTEEELDEQQAAAKYDGAHVIEPNPGIYYNPIGVLDFNSLYPSCEIAWNISHDSIILEEQYNNLEGFEYYDIEYTEYEVDSEAKTKKDKFKAKDSTIKCRYVQVGENDTHIGIIPKVCKRLLQARKDVRKQMKGITDPVMLNILDCTQLAYKLTCNSVYGQTGASTSPIYYKSIGACTTAMGKRCLELAYNVGNSFDGVNCIYGDSVMGYTPILIRDPETNITHIVEIECLAEKNEFVEYPGFKANEGPLARRFDKQQAPCAFEVWTDQGWSKIVRVIKHKTDKKIYRVVSSAGIVDATEDHSLLHRTPDGEIVPIKPTYENMEEPIELLSSYPEPDDFEVSEDLSHDSFYNPDIEEFEVSDKFHIRAAYTYHWLKKLGLNPGIEYDAKKKVFNIIKNYPMKSRGFSSTLLIKNQMNTVYDLETEVGRFHAGVGSLIVKNTDSNFYEITNLPEDATTEEKLAKTKVICEGISAAVNKAIGKEGIINFAYEKIFNPFLIVSKKRYYGYKYEDKFGQNDYSKKVMGMAIARRNYCKFTKKLMQEILDLLMNAKKKDPAAIQDFLVSRLDLLIDQKVPLDQLTITNSLKETYKNPESTPHWVLAQTMRSRGETVNMNDRIAYIFKMIEPVYNTKGAPKDPKVVDIVEEYSYAKDNEIMYDPEVYIQNQLREPITQILKFAIDNSEEIFDRAVNRVHKIKHGIYGDPVPAKRTVSKRKTTNS